MKNCIPIWIQPSTLKARIHPEPATALSPIQRHDHRSGHEKTAGLKPAHLCSFIAAFAFLAVKSFFGRFVVNSASLFRLERLERFELLERLERPECFEARERSTVEA